jgi:hypothetical protein
VSSGFRVTVEDLETGEKQSRVVSEGDYMLIPFAPCYLHSAQRYGNGTVSVTLKGYAPLPVEQAVNGDV